MANQEHLRIIRQGAAAWNRWRGDNYEIQLRPDLSEADLEGVDLSGADLTYAKLCGAKLGRGRFRRANFTGADLRNADLREADLALVDLSGADFAGADLSGEKTRLWKAVGNGTNFVGANLSGAYLSEVSIGHGAKLSGKDTNLSHVDLSDAWLCGSDLRGANLSGACLSNANLCHDFGRVDLSDADLSDADLYQANLTGAVLERANLYNAFLGEATLRKANLSGADLRDSNLEGANLVESVLDRAKLAGSRVYGVSVWKASLESAEQRNLVVTPEGEPAITVDDLRVAQFIYLILKNQEIRHVIDTMTSKIVLILGNFSKERKSVLNAIRDEIRRRNLAPILFDFEKPTSKDLTGTVETLARMAKFIIADLTDPRSIPHELATVVPHLRTTPVLPLRLVRSRDPGDYAMFDDPRYRSAYSWILQTHEYKDEHSLISELPQVIAPANSMAEALRLEKPATAAPGT